MKKLIPELAFFILFSSCSLKYSETPDVSASVPELVFEDSTMTRYENSNINLEMTVEKLEQYKNSQDTYAQGVEFKTFENGDVSTEGQCNYILMNSDAELYMLYNNISLKNYKENVSFFADSLKWNAKTEQLTSGIKDKVTIKKDDTQLSGKGFSASGISKKFVFSSDVTGEIESQ